MSHHPLTIQQGVHTVLAQIWNWCGSKAVLDFLAVHNLHRKPAQKARLIM